MTRRVTPALLIGAAGYGAGADHQRLALYALLASIPLLAYSAVEAFGRYVDGSSPLAAVLLGAALGMAVLGAASGARSAIAGALVLLAGEAAFESVRERLERQRPRRVAGEVD